MNNRESFSRPFSPKLQIEEGVEEYYNSPEQIEKRDKEQKEEDKKFKALCEHIYKVGFVVNQQLEKQRQKDKEDLRQLKIQEEKKEQEFEILCKTHLIEEPSDILKFPREFRSKVLSILNEKIVLRIENLADFRKRIFSYIDNNAGSDDFSYSSLKSFANETIKEFSFSGDISYKIMDRINHFWVNYKKINEYKKKNKYDVIKDFCSKEKYNMLDLKNIDIFFTPYAIVFNFVNTNYSLNLENYINFEGIKEKKPPTAYSYHMNGVEYIVNTSEYNSVLRHELQHAKDSLFGMKGGIPDTLQISTERTKLEIFAFLAQGYNTGQMKFSLKNYYQGFTKYLKQKDQELYKQITKDAFEVIDEMRRKEISNERIIELFSSIDLDKWRKNYNKFLKK